MNRRLGQIMVAENLLTNEQIDEVINFKNENRCHFGAACVELGFLTERQVMEVLGIQPVSYTHLTLPTSDLV